METVLKMVHLIRSTRSEYNLTNKQKTTAHLIISPELNVDELRALFRNLQSLANSELSEDKPPIGCSILTVSNKIELHLVLKVRQRYRIIANSHMYISKVKKIR